MGLTAADILGNEDRKIEKVAVPEWGGDVYVRSLSLEESLALNDKVEAVARNDMPLQMALQAAAFLCDENGVQLITSDEDIAKLKGRRLPAIVRISKAGNALNNSSSVEAVKEK